MGMWTPNDQPAPQNAAANPSITSAPPSDQNPPFFPSPPGNSRRAGPVEKIDNLLDDISEGHAPDTTDTSLRYAAYTNRIRTILTSAHRYVAYTSEIGESFRPVAHPLLVRSAYGISWAYILGDVGYEGYKAYLANQKKLFPEDPSQPWRDGSAIAEATECFAPRAVPPLEDYRTVMVQRGVFQTLASMALPAFTIHTLVKYSGKAMKGVKNPGLRTWGPVGLGLGVVPFLPSIFDEPVENAVEWVFHEGFRVFGGQGSVGNSPATGRERALGRRMAKEQAKEKNL